MATAICPCAPTAVNQMKKGPHDYNADSFFPRMEIVDELDTVKDMQALARQSWEKRAKTLGLLEASPKSETVG